MNPKRYLSWSGVLWVAGCLLAGCGGENSQAGRHLFDKSPPEIKADWERACTADQNNDFFTASVSYANVVKQESKLTPKQFAVAEAASRALTERMRTEAEKGNPTAKQALARLMDAQRRR
jgi:hypothetical protein